MCTILSKDNEVILDWKTKNLRQFIAHKIQSCLLSNKRSQISQAMVRNILRVNFEYNRAQKYIAALVTAIAKKFGARKYLLVCTLLR